MAIKSLFKAVFLLSSFSVATRLLGFLYKIFLSRYMTTSMLGIYTIALSVFMVFITVISSGVSVSITKYSPTFSRKNQDKLVYSGLIISLILTIICILFILIFKNFFIIIFSNYECYLILLTMLPALIATGIYTPIKGNLLGNEQYLQASIVEFIEQIIKIIACIICFYIINNNLNFLSPGIGISISCILSTILGIIIYKKNNGSFNKSNQFFKPLIKSASPITGVRLLSSLISPLISIILPIKLMKYGMSSEMALSELGVTMGMTMPILSIPFTLIGSLSMALIPKVSHLNNENNDKQLKKQIHSSIMFTIICTIIIFPIFSSLGVEICDLIFSNTQSGKYLSISSWLIIPMGIAQLTSTILNALGEENKTFIYYILGNSLLLLSITFLPKYLGILSVVYGLGVCNLLIAFLNVIKLNKLINLKHFYLKEIIFMLLIAIPCSLFCRLTYNIFLTFLPSLLSLLLTSIITTISLFLLLVCFKFINLKVIKNYLPLKKKTA